MVYGTADLTLDYLPGPEGGEARGFGLFGGYPVGGNLGDSILLLTSKEDLNEKFSKGIYPTNNDQLAPPWGINARKSSEFLLERQLGGIRVNVPEYSLIGYSFGCGGGYGDPLDRDPQKVMEDVKNESVTLRTAANIYGVILHPRICEVDFKKTEERRQEMRMERLSKAEKLTPRKAITKLDLSAKKRVLIRLSEYLEVVEKKDGMKMICCIKCGNEFCVPGDNYKKYALRWTRDLHELKIVTESEESIMSYQEYICPGCGTLLHVDPWCSLIDNNEPLWDIDVKL